MAVAGCSEPPPVEEPPPPKVTVAHPEERELIDYDQFNGWTEASETVEVRSRVRGHIKEVHFTDGQLVKKGALLFELDPRPYQTEIDRARDQLSVDEAQLDFATAEAQRYEELFAKNVATKSDVEQYRANRNSWAAKVEAAKQEIKRRELDLEYASILAETSGRVGRARLTAGNLVNAGGSDPLLTTIVNSDPIHVYFAVDERSLLKYRRLRTAKQDSSAATEEPAAEEAEAGHGADQPADSEPDAGTSPGAHPVKDLKIPMEFGLETDTGFPHRGVIDFSDNRIDPETGTIEVRGAASNGDGEFVAGSRVRVQIPVSEPYKAILVPDEAILSDQDQRYVLVINDENVVLRREVTPGRLLSDGMRVILPAAEPNESLSPSDLVIVIGLQRARINYPVEPVDADGKPIARNSPQN